MIVIIRNNCERECVSQFKSRTPTAPARWIKLFVRMQAYHNRISGQFVTIFKKNWSWWMPLRIFWLRRSQSSSHFNDIINNIDHGTSGKRCGARVDFDSMVFQRFNGYRIWWLVKPYQIIFSSVRFKRILYDFFNLGDIDDDIDFSYEADTEVYYSWQRRWMKRDASSQFCHYNVLALGSYRESPFVTVNDALSERLKAEIHNIGTEKREQVADFPFSNGDRWVYKIFF